MTFLAHSPQLYYWYNSSGIRPINLHKMINGQDRKLSISLDSIMNIRGKAAGSQVGEKLITITAL